MKKSGFIAFLLAFIPGIGHAYLNRKIRAFFFFLAFLGVLTIGVLFAFMSGDEDPLLLGFLGGFVVWGVNMLDVVVTLLTRQEAVLDKDEAGGTVIVNGRHTDERLTVILLSFIPGLGHLHLGLMNRGLTLLGSFFGLIAMVLFILAVTHNMVFVVFLCLLAVIWLFGMFDAVRMLELKSRGEDVSDRSIFEDLEEFREAGRKSGMIAAFLSVFPGAGHMYLGLQRRGLQLMAAFLFSIYLLDALRISLFLFLIPLIWFFSFFDALQQIGKYRRQILEDVPVVEYLMNHQKWIGIGLLALGGFYLLDRAVIPSLERMFPDVQISFWFDYYFQTTVVSILLIGGGIKLLIGSRRKKEDQQ